jgi:hypothetical protein
LGEVEKRTDQHRVAKAQHHSRRAGQVKAERLAAGRPYEEAIEGARWHHRRACGQVNRFVGVLDCGTEKFWLVCDACSRIKERVRECRVALLCISCRSVIGREKRFRFALARQQAVSRVQAMGLHRLGRHGGRWSEKLMTLTLPHLAEHTVGQRIEIAFRALLLFRKAFKKWLQSFQSSELVAWFRTFEWTPGSDRLGHPHFHFWLLCPYLDATFLRTAWAQALCTAGFSRQAVQNVVLDLREVRDGIGVANEVIKYLTKDILPDRQLVDPVVFGVVYEALDGRRTTQASSGFFRGISDKAVCECGVSGAFKRTTTRPEPRPATIAGQESEQVASAANLGAESHDE